MHKDLIAAIKNNQAAFGLDLHDEAIARLADHYDLVQQHNPLLHLVAPCSPEEFATRHILESLTLLKHLPHGAKFADVGTGAGLPSIPCLLVRDDLHAVLIESKEKKVKFLETAKKYLGLNERAEIVDRQFEEADVTGCKFITCRALDKFTEKLPRLIKWSGRRQMLLFGGPTFAEALQKHRVPFSSELMPMSIQRSLFVSDRS